MEMRAKRLCRTCNEPIEGDIGGPDCRTCLAVILCGATDIEDAEPVEPEAGDWVTEDHIVFREFEGKGLIRIPPGGPWQPAVRDRMERERWWPNVWFLSDHGNYHLMSMGEDE